MYKMETDQNLRKKIWIPKTKDLNPLVQNQNRKSTSLKNLNPQNKGNESLSEKVKTKLDKTKGSESSTQRIQLL